MFARRRGSAFGRPRRTGPIIDDVISPEPLKAAVEVANEGVVAEGDRAKRSVDLGVVLEDRFVVAPKMTNPCGRPDRRGLRRHDDAGQIAVDFERRHSCLRRRR
jgi:hypothetical protein